jgi:TatD DNase family protein
MLIDSHAHLSTPSLREDLPLLLENAKKSRVEAIIDIATTGDELKDALDLQKKYPWIFVAGATTPHDVATRGDLDFEAFSKQAKTKRLVAIGETGLDYHYKHSPIELQKFFFRKYFELALECALPLIIHCRDAFEDLFLLADGMKGSFGQSPKTALHCFTGTLSEADQVVERGWYLSLSGIVTFKNSAELKEVAKRVPLSQLLIETDTPYLAPTPHRGKTNEPAFLIETARCIATLRNIPLEELAQATSQNARTFFQIP